MVQVIPHRAFVRKSTKQGAGYAVLCKCGYRSSNWLQHKAEADAIFHLAGILERGRA